MTQPSPAWRRYLRFWRRDIDADLDDEFRFHVDAEVEYLIARGWSVSAARDEALRRFGDVDQSRRDCRSADQRRAGREHRQENFVVLKQDLRFALRALRRNPGFTAVVVLTLALGIGANTAIFSVVHTVLLQPLPYRQPEQLVMLWETRPGSDRPLVSYKNFEDWRQRQRSFSDIAAYYPFASFTMTGRGDAERVDGALVSGSYLQLLGARPALGRLVTPADDAPGAAPVAVLGNGFFQSRFGGDPSVVGSTLLLDGEAYTVVGVLAPDVSVSYRAGDMPPQVVLPLGLFRAEAAYSSRAQPSLFAVGRLAAGVTTEQGVADIKRVSTELRAEYPADDAGLGATGVPLMYMSVKFSKPGLEILMAAVALVLLIACANVTSLVLSRSAARQREFAVRTALGAGRGRIVRQVLTENIVLALVGGTLGIGIAIIGVRLLVRMHRGTPRIADSRVDVPVLLFALLVSIVTGLLFGLAPALEAGRARLVPALKEGGRLASGGASRQLTRAALTVAEVALAVVLLAGAGLLVRSFARLMNVDPGFQPSHAIAGMASFPLGRYPTVDRSRAALDQLLAKARAIPGVENAALGSSLPICCSEQSPVTFASRTEADPSKRPLLNVNVVDPDYFATLRIPLVGGRPIEAGDRTGQPQVAVVSERVAKKFFPGANPIGDRLRLAASGGGTDTGSWRTIVGVVRDTRTDGLTEPPRGTVYLPRAQAELRSAWIIVRSQRPVDQVTAELRRALTEVDRDVPLESVKTMKAAMAVETEGHKSSMLMLALLAAVALALASIGIYGVISYNVTQRTGEIGVRVALGAQRRDVMVLVVGQAMAMALAGVAIGVLLALLGGKSLSAMLFGVSPRDPFVLGAASAFLLIVALGAALAPAVRAMRIDPTIAMRAD
ncbi:MAG TPA: ABC transporter permease [Gemmatimonadaceae bacterium]|nr:ABC transporter permease [Gemmatimonadaceae bacterium]